MCKAKTGVRWICVWMWLTAFNNFGGGTVFLPVAVPNIVMAIIISFALCDPTLEKRKCAYIAMIITTVINAIGWIGVIMAMFWMVPSNTNRNAPIFFEVFLRIWFIFCLKNWHDKKKDKIKDKKMKEAQQITNAQVMMVPQPGQVQYAQG